MQISCSQEENVKANNFRLLKKEYSKLLSVSGNVYYFNYSYVLLFPFIQFLLIIVLFTHIIYIYIIYY